MVRALIALLFCMIQSPALGRTLLHYEGTETGGQDTSYYEFEFSISENGSMMVMDLNSQLDHGELNIWFGGAGYQVIGDYTGSGSFHYTREIFGPLSNAQPVTVRITIRQAAGEWLLDFREIPRSAMLFSLLVSGCLVVLLTAAITVWAKRHLSISWKWLLVGAGTWVVGVIFKFVTAYFANAPLLQIIKSSFGDFCYAPLGGVYIGLLTGVFEIGMTLVFALLVRQMLEKPEYALGVGLGAGLIEALLIGLSSVGSFVTAMVGATGSNAITGAVAQAAVLTPFIWLISSVERMIAVACHASSRTLVIFAVAHRKQRYFWTGFLILTLIDSIAGYYHLSGLINKVSSWWIELLLLPVAVVSIPIIKWCFRKWQNPPQDEGLKG
ncbi:MAG: YhfC family intramembrane metalloprotease [candidate division WOR-3 bacterium]|nr:MAG: YhfC family intramembrane metalloprotease [candidate division WOR-3 bacterium]